MANFDDDLIDFDEIVIPCEFCELAFPPDPEILLEHMTGEHPEQCYGLGTSTVNNATNEIHVNNDENVQNNFTKSLVNDDAITQQQQQQDEIIRNLYTVTEDPKIEAKVVQPESLISTPIDNENEHKIYDLKIKGTFNNLKMKKNEEKLNINMTISDSQCNESFNNFEQNKPKYSGFESTTAGENVNLSDDDEASETIEQFCKRAKDFLKSRSECSENKDNYRPDFKYHEKKTFKDRYANQFNRY